MKVAVRLRRLEAAQPAAALLLLSHEPAELLALLNRLKAQPRVHHVADGFLVCLAERSGTATSYGSAIRLRKPYERLYVPVDAELVPALLDDEARGLVRDQGLVFLPNGRVLSFEASRPLNLVDLLDIGERRRGLWAPLPSAPVLADRIYKITFNLPAENPDDLLTAAGPEVGSDTPRPEESGPVSQSIGKAMMGAGKALFNLGNLMRLRALAAAGAKILAKAIQVAPRLTEEILGKQEAALRDLLRRFREGKLEDALRHAIPFAGDGGRGGIAGWGTSLPMQQWLYSLGSLLGSGSGPASVWFGSHDVQAELAREYRKAAEKAAQNGDFRRAALIYGKLLGDYRAAAQMLLRGGLFHDAAIIFLKKLNDRRAAAQAFESGSEFDRALELYRQLEEHLLAAQLLRRLDDEEGALAEFQRAAQRHAAGGDFHAGGIVMLDKAQRRDLARPYFEAGWQHRPAGNAVACALRLAHLYSEEGEASRLIGLAHGARAFFDPPGNENGAEQYYSTLAGIADNLASEAKRDELRDLALMGLGVKLRQSAAVEKTPGIVVSNFMGRSGKWPAPVVRDAQVAVAAAINEHGSQTDARSATRVRLGTGQVTAVARAPHTGEVFAGFLSGDVAVFRPTTGETVRIKSGDGRAVTGLAAGPEGHTLLVLQGSEQANLSSYSRSLDGGYLHNNSLIDAGHATYGLPPVLSGESDCWYVVGKEMWMQMRTVHSAVGGELHPPIHSDQVVTVLVFSAGEDATDGATLILYARNMLWHSVVLAYATVQAESFHALALGWTPGLPESNSLHAPPLACLRYASELELAGVDEDGVVHWSRLVRAGAELSLAGACDRSCEGGYRAAAFVRPGVVAAVTPSRVDWLRAGQNHFLLQGSSPMLVPFAVACFASAATHELLVICRDGTLVRVPLPAA